MLIGLVVVPEVQPKRFWYALLFNQRGVILDRAIRRGTLNVVVCRLRFRLEQFASHGAGPAPRADVGPAPDAAAAPAAADPSPSGDH
jgi:hypothetical protein